MRQQDDLEFGAALHVLGRQGPAGLNRQQENYFNGRFINDSQMMQLPRSTYYLFATRMQVRAHNMRMIKNWLLENIIIVCRCFDRAVGSRSMSLDALKAVFGSRAALLKAIYAGKETEFLGSSAQYRLKFF